MNAIKSLSIRNLTAFREANFEFSPGINVLIGENATGKTHVLKLLYVLLKSAAAPSDHITSDTLSLKLPSVFMADSELVGELLRRDLISGNNPIHNKGEVCLEFQSGEQTGFSLELGIHKVNKLGTRVDVTVPTAIYLPARDILSLYPGFIAAYLNRESAFDETYYDLAVALNASLLRKAKYQEVKHLNEPLEELLGGEDKVTLRNDHFYVEFPDSGKLEAHLVAEGYRKIAALYYLIRNGTLAADNVLLWDEPEANLNPALITAVVEFLIGLANAGAQVFLATHDYLLTYELSLRAEYGLNNNIKFFSLYREAGKDGVQVQEANSMVDIDHDPLLDAFIEHDRRVDQLFLDRAAVVEQAV